MGICVRQCMRKDVLECVRVCVRMCVTKPFDDIFQPYTGHLVMTKIDAFRLVQW